MFADECINAGVRVLREEAQCLLDLVPSIDQNFVKACEIICKIKGKVILTGVGKSGHVASKIASTLASTGTQSFFVQAGEAAHGDLGMVGMEDCVIAVSNSGESSELKIMLPVLLKRKIPLIAITGNPNSSLAKTANVVLSAHVEREACPLNLAPTSSSTAELVIGDALAVALIEAKGFTEHDFALSHPGGALGRRLLCRCADLMHTGDELPKIPQTSTIKDALLIMSRNGLGMVITVDSDDLVRGVFTDGDLRRTLEKNTGLDTTLDKVMSTDIRGLIFPEMLATDALARMRAKRINSVIVIDRKQRPLGVVNFHDLMLAGII